ncbi:MAG TPA: hypothetical protein PLK30_16555 [Blastocatellia bacterium]|nr:hypothetical protein [Blastocatellia bacterium]
MNTFDSQSFRQFLGQPVERKYDWGTEQRFTVSEELLVVYEEILKETINRHHSSFDFSDEIAGIGFPLAAQAMRYRNSGNPADDKTQMGNLGEVIGAEFSRAYLGFQAVYTYPKRFNTNVDQAMKGVDILGLRAPGQSAQLLIGEAKCAQRHDERLIEDAYKHLDKLEREESSRILRFMKEYHRLSGNRELVENTDRHMAKSVPRDYLIISVTLTVPRSPFSAIAEQVKQSPLHRPLLAVHIQFETKKSWLTNLFEP